MFLFYIVYTSLAPIPPEIGIRPTLTTPPNNEITGNNISHNDEPPFLAGGFGGGMTGLGLAQGNSGIVKSILSV